MKFEESKQNGVHHDLSRLVGEWPEPMRLLEKKDLVVRTEINNYLKLAPAVFSAPNGYLWSSYDAAANVLYINFKKPSVATDSELTDDDVIIRCEGDEIVGLTILNFSKRNDG